MSDSKTISNKERHVKRFRTKGVSIKGKMLLKIKNTSHIIAVRGIINRVLEPKSNLKPPRLQIKVQERLTQYHNLEVIVSI